MTFLLRHLLALVFLAASLNAAAAAGGRGKE